MVDSQKGGGNSKQRRNAKRRLGRDTTDALLANLGHGKPEGSGRAWEWMLRTYLPIAEEAELPLLVRGGVFIGRVDGVGL